MGQAPFVHKDKEQESRIGRIRVSLRMSIADLRKKAA